MSTDPPRLGLRQARRLAVAAQGLARRPAGRLDRRHLRATLDRLGVVQMDAVNVVARAHEITLHARLGPVPAALAELVEDGALFEARVEGWDKAAYLDAGATIPRRAPACALISPFDPLIWHRPRARRLFGFDYRLEIYKPAAQRRFGYYVLPFVLGDRPVARVDLKAARADGRLLVRSAFGEPGIDPGTTAAALAESLRAMAHWLGLGTVRVEHTGDLAAPLAREIGA